VHSWSKSCRKFLVGDKSAQWQSSCQRLRHSDHIGKRAKRLIRKVSAGPAKATLNLVGDQRSIVLRSEVARALPKFLADRENPALALDRFYNKRANRIIKLALKIGHIIELHKLRARNKRSEWLAIFRRVRDGNRAERATMKRILKRENPRLLRDAAHAPLQSLAQGAGMAIEDGLCLAESIHAADGDYQAAFRRFEAARLLRTARVQLESRSLWDFYHLDEGIARDVRNATVADWDEAHLFDCLSWLYDGAPMPDPAGH